MKKNKATLVRWKIYVDRARMYVSYVQFLMIVLVLLESYKGTKLGQWIFDNTLISIPIIFVLFIALSIVVGKIDTILGLRQEELRNHFEANPVIKKIQEDLKEIKNQLNKENNIIKKL